MADRTKVLAGLAKDAVLEESYLAEFQPPSSWSPPDDARNGREFEAMVSLKQKPDGTLCITKLGGIEKDEGGEVVEEEVEETQAVGGGYGGY